ncbi:MAG: TIGR00341 family protein [Opitutales bacterium]
MDDSIRVIDATSTPLADDRTAHFILAEADAVEPLVEALSERFEEHANFRIAVSEVITLVPEPEEKDVAQSGSRDQQRNKNAANRIAREELLEVLRPGTEVDRLYLATTSLSCLIAAMGLIQDSPAVVIGAMMIAPLLIPNMSLALGTTLGDLKMAAKSLRSNGCGIVLSLALSITLGFFLPFDPAVDEIAARTSVSYLDVALALAAGAAGAIAVSTGVSANLIGVMVAVALLPPVVAFGLLVGAGEFQLARGAGLMSGINVICVNLAAVCTFLLSGVRPNRWNDEALARRATWTALTFWFLMLLGAVLLLRLVE